MYFIMQNSRSLKEAFDHISEKRGNKIRFAFRLHTCSYQD